MTRAQVTAYALMSAQERGTLFCKPGDEVYEGQVAGIHQRAGDLRINVCKKKALTNMRASGKDSAPALDGAKDLSLDDWCGPPTRSISPLCFLLCVVASARAAVRASCAWLRRDSVSVHVRFVLLRGRGIRCCCKPRARLALPLALLVASCTRSFCTGMRILSHTKRVDRFRHCRCTCSLEYIIDDELVEVTPTSVRIRKNPDVRSSNKKQPK